MCTQPKKGVLYKFAADWTTCSVAAVKQPAMQVWVCPRSLPWTSMDAIGDFPKLIWFIGCAKLYNTTGWL